MEKEKIILPVDGREGSSLLDWGEPVKVAVCENCDWQFFSRKPKPCLNALTALNPRW